MNEKNCLLVLNAAEARVQLVLARVEGGFNGLDAVAEGTRIETLCTQDWFAPSRGTEILPAALEGVFKSLEMRPSCLGRIACVQGPGSFTGIRLALTLGAALKRTTGAALVGINYLQAVAATGTRCLRADQPCVLRILTHARRGLLHRQDFLYGGAVQAAPQACSSPEMVSLEAALEDCPADRSTWIWGSGVTRNAETLLARLPEGVRRLDAPDSPSAEALLWLGLHAEATLKDLEPLYLRHCDAVDNLASIAEKSGRNPEEARARLETLLSADPVP